MDGEHSEPPVRRPGSVPDEGTELLTGADTDGDGLPDTVLTTAGADLLVESDLDADGLVDRVLRIGPDGVVHHDPALGGVAADRATGSVPGEWPGLLGRLFGPDP